MKTRVRNSRSGLSSGVGTNKKRRIKKLLLVAAVILFIWIFVKGEGGSLVSKNLPTSATQILNVGSQSSKEDAPAVEILGGPLASLEQILFSSASGAIDFAADDEFEDQDLVILQENSLVASQSPAPEEIFSRFRKEIIEYIVQKGDTPTSIAFVYGINTDTLLWANNLKDGDLIRPGDKLIILPINGIRVKVSARDTIESLAKKYQGKSEEIIAFNSLSADGGLQAGQYIIIPGGEKPVEVAPKPKIITPKYASSTQKAGTWLIIPTTGNNWGRTHSYNGVDIANDCGTPVYAAAGGVVILSDASGWNGGYGKYIKIQHPNGVVTLYGHASALLVSQGQSVSQGQLIAYMGTTGRSTGCHLHFEVRGATNPLAKKR